MEGENTYAGTRAGPGQPGPEEAEGGAVTEAAGEPRERLPDQTPGSGAAAATAAGDPAPAAGRDRARRTLVAAAWVALGALVGAIAGTAATLAWIGPARYRPVPLPPPVPARPVVYSGQVDVVQIYKQAAPAVVQILTPTGTGSGFIFDPAGYILTNNHVVEGARRVRVLLDDGRDVPGRVLGVDPGNDVAVVAIEAGPAPLPTLPLGDSDSVQPGEPAIAIGFPLDEGKSVTAGIISGTGRVSERVNDWTLSGLIQTDAAINPGNSGGPLLNAAGQVIGINTLIASPVRGFTGIGFAVPVNAVRAVLPDLLAGRRVEHPWLGIGGIPVNPELAEEVGLPVTSGILVQKVYPGTAAEEAGLRPAVQRPGGEWVGGDVITAIDGRALRDVAQLQSYLASRRVGDRVRLTVRRGDQTLTVEATLTARPEREALR